MRRRLAPLAVLTLLALALAAAALADQEQIRLTAEGESAARAALPRQADFGVGWVRKAYKPSLSSETHCASFNPKQSDLVLNGAAGVKYTHPGIEIAAETQVLETERMVALDWQRTVKTPAVLPCLRTMAAKSLPAGARFVSAKRLAFPKVSTYADAFRLVVEVTAGGTSVQMFVDVVAVGRKRTEVTLTTIAPLAADAAVRAAEVRLAQMAVARTTA